MHLKDDTAAYKVAKGINDAEETRVRKSKVPTQTNVEAENVGEDVLIRTNYPQYSLDDYNAIKAGFKIANKNKLPVDLFESGVNPQFMLDSAFTEYAVYNGDLKEGKKLTTVNAIN